MPSRLRIATRESPLALWQAEYVKGRLLALHPGLEVRLVPMTTAGDRWLKAPLARVGGKGLFVKELERALLEGEADIAVHSMKDVPVEVPEGLSLPVVLAREDPRDAFVSLKFQGLEALPEGARVGTSSLRRKCQLKARHPHLEVVDLRGNVNTRLKRLDEGRFAAILLAAAGLKRLGLEGRITRYLPIEESLPAIGQGALGIECREGDEEVLALIAPLNDPATQACVAAERAFNEALEGGCQAPIAAHATLEGETLTLRGLVGRPDGSALLKGTREGPASAPEALGRALGEELLARGARGILHG